MFIERLTKEQVENYLNQEYSTNEGWSYDFFSIDTGYHCNIHNDQKDFGKCIRLEDFYASAGCSTTWKKYLYHIFGEEYKIEYSKYCLKELEQI